MKILLVEQVQGSELNVDINLPYIKGFLDSKKIDSIYLRYINFEEIIGILNEFKPDIIITNDNGIHSVLKFKSKKFNSVSFIDFISSYLKTTVNIFQFLPVFDCYNRSHLEESRYIPHLVFSNVCNYTKKVFLNPIYKGIKLPDNIKLSGCSFCSDVHSNIKWEIKEKKNIIDSLLVAVDYAKRSKHKSIRILGEAFTSRPDKIFFLLKKYKISDINIIITLRPELLGENINYFIKALKIASESKNKLILCSIGIESFYDYDLMLYNRCLSGKDILKIIYLLYKLKDMFKENLLLDRYELFNFILFHPYTAKESLEYNLRIMNAIGIERISKSNFLNALRINDNTAIKYLIKKDGLLIDDIEWKFKDKSVELFYNDLKKINSDFFDMKDLFKYLYKNG